MESDLRVVNFRQVNEVSAVELTAASYLGSGSISGMFEIFDPDYSFSKNLETGKLTVSVICHFGASDNEDDTLELEIDSEPSIVIEGYTGEIVDRIAFSK